MEEKSIEEIALDEELGKKLFVVDEYWTGLKTKGELKSQKIAI